MRLRHSGSVIIVAVLAAALVFPVAATANPLVVERSIRGSLPDGTALSTPDISTDWLVYGEEHTGSFRGVYSYYLGGGTSWTWSGPTADVDNPAVAGDWVVWGVGGDIKARKVKSATVVAVSPESPVQWNGRPQVSASDGSYVVWYRQSGGQFDVMAKNLGTTGSAFELAAGTGNQVTPAIHGKHVVYVSDVSGVNNVYFKTIGSTDAAVRLAPSTREQSMPDIGNHVAVWLEPNDSGKFMIRYYDFNTGVAHDGPSFVGQHVQNPQVSGDRILYNVSNGADQDLYVLDVRLGKSSEIAGTNLNDAFGRIEGNQLTYMSGGMVYYARLQVPSIALNAVPKRIPHHGHIHLTGSISDQGHRITGAGLQVEKYSSGKWVLVKAIAASATGAFSYKTATIHSKTKFRVVYNGFSIGTLGDFQRHLSTVSAVKTAWPR